MSENATTCEKCGKWSSWAHIRVSNGETALCYDCIDGQGINIETTNEVACTCESRDLFHFGCRCNYAKRKKKCLKQS